jgi:hypothetical protein
MHPRRSLPIGQFRHAIGRAAYPWFLEGTYATATGFRKDGARTGQTESDSVPFHM